MKVRRSSKVLEQCWARMSPRSLADTGLGLLSFHNLLYQLKVCIFPFLMRRVCGISGLKHRGLSDVSCGDRNLNRIVGLVERVVAYLWSG